MDGFSTKKRQTALSGVEWRKLGFDWLKNYSKDGCLSPIAVKMVMIKISIRATPSTLRLLIY